MGQLAAVPVARAEEASSPPDEAVAAYEQARAHYKAGRYPAAIEQLERALFLDPDSPELLYNVARVYELMGDLGKAAAYYRRYRDMLPEGEAEERARVDETIARLRGAQLYVEPPETEAESPPPPPPPPAERGVADAAVWTLLGVSGGTLASAAGCGGTALRREKELRDFVLGEDGDAGEREALQQKADRLALTSDVLVGLGAASALTALVLYLARTKPPEAAEARAVRLLPSGSGRGLGFTLRGAF